MVLESLLNPRKAERQPWELFFVGLVYASFAFLLSYWVFKEYISIVMVAMTSICAVPIMYNIMLLEEQKDEEHPRMEFWLLKEHGKAVGAFTFLFIGFVTAFVIWFIALPSGTVEQVFDVQINAISQVHSDTSPSGNFFVSADELMPVLMNNLKILIFCFLMSFFFGAGAIFILTWNASVIAVAIGVFVRNKLMTHLGSAIAAYSQVLSIGVAKYLTHGIFEIVAYFVGALAGGILSIAVIRHEWRTPAFKRTILDSVDIVALSIIILAIAAVVEVFVTPRLF
ncbi:stage II sporulation protein M [Candidatus Woesearchaeota archaeon]|nr:stage II sporulation protein M [Candidatus Woesearchaeota archaeon]